MTPLLVAAALVLTSAACGDDSDDIGTIDPGANGPGVVDPGSDDPDARSNGDNGLVGRTFVMDDLHQDGEGPAWTEGTEIEIEISFPEPDRLAWNAGCNSYGGSVDITADTLVVTATEGTEMGCEPDLMDAEDWLTNLLASDPLYDLDGSWLTLQSDGGFISLVEQGGQSDAALEGTTWQVETLLDGDAASPVPDGVEATVEFGPDMLGMEVCNGAGSAYRVENNEIEIEGMIGTLMACDQPLDGVEQAVMGVLDGTITYEIDGDRLTLLHPSGRGLVLVATES